jgi:hypothetical protein
MRMTLIMVLSLLLVSVSLAHQESLITGPYKISFDLNTTEDYRVNNMTKNSETYCGMKYEAYTMVLSTDYNLALITVTHFADKMDKSIYNIQNYINILLSSLNYYSIVIHNRTIDNQSGVLGVGVNTYGDCMYAAEYWPIFSTSGETNVQIETNFPWENETLSLLRTISIKMINNTAQVQ